MRVLVAEPEAPLLRILERGLRAHGYEVVCAETAEHVVAAAGDDSIRCVVLDRALAGSAADVLRERVRAQRPQLPVIVLTARGDQRDPNGDDLLPKPFAFEELIARIHARTRGANEQRLTTLTVGDIRLDLLAQCAWRGDRFIDLPSREFALLEYFMRHPGRVLSRQAILADVWGYDYDAGSDSNLVDVYVRYVRNKIAQSGTPPLIATVRGEGYRFDPPPAIDARGSPIANPQPSAREATA